MAVTRPGGEGGICPADALVEAQQEFRLVRQEVTAESLGIIGRNATAPDQ
jgi:hypothetical protein